MSTMTQREGLKDAIAKAIADCVGHGMREKCERHADAVMEVIAALLRERESAKAPPCPCGGDAEKCPGMCQEAKAVVTEVQKLERWGKAPAGSKYLLQPMDDGYWTPWHIAQQALEAVAPRLASARVPDAHDIAQKVREALDREACPDAWMTRAYEAAVNALAAPKPEKE